MATPLSPDSTFVFAQILLCWWTMQQGYREEEQDSGKDDDEDRLHADGTLPRWVVALFFQPIALERGERELVRGQHVVEQVGQRSS